METPWSLSMRQVLVKGSERAPTEFSLVRQLFPNFRGGLEYMPRSDRVSPVWTWRFLEADGWQPAVALGQSSAWPSSKTDGSAFLLTAAQDFGEGWGGYVSVSYAPRGDLWQVPAGASWRFHDAWSSRLMWDGDNLHPILTHHHGRWSVSLILLDGKDPTISASFGF